MATETLAPYKAFKDANAGATTAKTFLLANSVPVLPLNTALAAVDNVFVYQCEAVRVPKATGQAWVPLAKIYWDDTAKDFTTTSTGNTLAGFAVVDAVSADTEGVIDLDPMAANA